MTYDKGAGKGPYTIKNTVNDLWLVYGPRGPLSGNIGHALAVSICAAANSGYADGRKAMEEDFQELLEIANRIRKSSRYSGGLKWVVDFENEFDDWKKARGIE